jgi:hypothetical protein
MASDEMSMRGEQVGNVGEGVILKQVAANPAVCFSVEASSKNTVFLSICQAYDKDSFKSLL